MNDNKGRQVLRESEWMTVYKLEGGVSLHESKFLVQGLVVNARSIKARWQHFSQEEKYDFVRAYQAKAEVTPEDEEILYFLMDETDATIWISIAPLLNRHRNRNRILAFLLEKVQQPISPKANLYQALEALKDKQALPVLRENYARYNEYLKDHDGFAVKLDYLDYLQCCRTLLVLEGSKEFEEALKRFLSFRDESVRRWAEMMLKK
jgi:hypothetical protein